MSEQPGDGSVGPVGASDELQTPARPAGGRDAARRRDADDSRRRDAELLERIRQEHTRRLRIAKARARRTGRPPEPIALCPDYQVLAARLVNYAVPTFKSLLRTGKIKQALLDRDLPHVLSPDDYERLHTSLEARDSLAITVVIAGEERFRNSTVLRRDGWDPDKGSKLETYFITGCLFDLQTAIRQWRREHPQWSTIGRHLWANGVLLEDLAPHDLPDVADGVGERDQLDRILRTAPPLVREIAALLLKDLTYPEIGERLGLSARAVEGQLYRFRTQLLGRTRRTPRITPLSPGGLTPGEAGAA